MRWILQIKKMVHSNSKKIDSTTIKITLTTSNLRAHFKEFQNKFRLEFKDGE
jgi:hypothetical protein